VTSNYKMQNAKCKIISSCHSALATGKPNFIYNADNLINVINMKKGVMLASAITIVFVLFVTPSAAANTPVKTYIGYTFLGLALVLTAFAYAYAFIRWREEKGMKRKMERDKVEEVIRLLKEAKRIKDEIERRGEKLTSETDITLTQILSGINELKTLMLSGINDLKTLILFGIGATLTLGIAIISLI